MSGSSSGGAAVRIVPASVFVCRNPEDGAGTSGGSLSFGAALKLRVEDAITGEPVVGAAVRRIKIDSQGPAGTVDWVDCDAGYHPFPVPDYARKLTDSEVKKLDDARKKIQEINALPGPERAKRSVELKSHRETEVKLETMARARRTWVSYLQSGLKLLGLYDGPVDGVMSSEFATHLVKTYKPLTKKDYSAGSAAKEIFAALKRKYSTDEAGHLVVALPLGHKGVVEIEFLYFKVVDPAQFDALGLDDADLTSAAVYRGSGGDDPADQPGSTTEESGWVYVTGKGETRFRNFIKVPFETPDEVPKEPLQARTRALVWCQPVFTVVDARFIWDPASGTRGHPNRGTVDLRPTTLVCTKGVPSWSKKYGEYGNQGRMSGGKPRMHSGIDLAGKKNDPVFALNGGQVSSTGTDDTGGRRVKVLPWQSGKPIAVFTVRHLVDGSPTVKVDQTVKAGDIVGKMGRTGAFPGESPTHTHFDCGLNIAADGTLASFLGQGFSAVFPHNDMPKILPCGEEYMGRSAANDPVGCDAERDLLADSCWALRELACPFLPADGSLTVVDGDLANNRSAKAVRKIHAQLLDLYETKKSPYLDPGPISGKPGTAESMVTVKAAAKYKTVWDEKQEKVLFKASAGEKFVQVGRDSATNRHRVELDAAQVKKYKAQAAKAGVALTAGIAAYIHDSQVDATVPGKLRLAVQAFRAATIDKGAPRKAPDCYRIDQAVVDRLEAMAPLKLQTPGKATASP